MIGDAGLSVKLEIYGEGGALVHTGNATVPKGKTSASFANPSGPGFEVGTLTLRKHLAPGIYGLEVGLLGEVHLIARYDTVHIHVEGRPAVSLDGIAARIVSELAELGGPVSWDVLAGEVWRGDDDRLSLRSRWDVALARLRRKLRDNRIRPDLIRASGTGRRRQVELVQVRRRHQPSRRQERGAPGVDQGHGLGDREVGAVAPHPGRGRRPGQDAAVGQEAGALEHAVPLARLQDRRGMDTAG